jgi:hypothetical protein
MEPKTIVHCCECRQPIISGEWFVCFKVPIQKIYQFLSLPNSRRRLLGRAP